ncbi:MAG: hypothetical protein CM15mP23_07750 [Cryomorphaceae bacterium]|nr:MAG: hypothetical protein CM15mP23_07750 [Cryomorphaceae bacterium]
MWQKTTHKKQSTAATQSILPSNTGNLSELVLVISEELWAGSAGKVITDVLQENIKAIPQQEALLIFITLKLKIFQTSLKHTKMSYGFPIRKMKNLKESIKCGLKINSMFICQTLQKKRL